MSQFQLGIPDIPRVTDVAIIPPVPNNAALFESVQRSLGLVGRGAGIIAQIGRIQSIERSRDAAEARREQRALEVTQRALGVSNADFDISNDRDAVLAGTLLPQEGESVDDFVERTIAKRVEGLPPESAQGYRRNLGPKLEAAVFAKQRDLRNQQRDEVIRINADGAIRATTAEGMLEHVQAVRDLYPELTEGEVLEDILVPALRSAAAQGDTGRFQAALTALGDNFEKIQIEATQVFNERRDQILAENDLDAANEFDMLLRAGASDQRLNQFVLDAEHRMSQGQLSQKATNEFRKVAQELENDRFAIEKKRSFSLFEQQVEFGRVPMEEGEEYLDAVDRETARRAQLPPGDPDSISVTQRRQLLERAGEKVDQDIATIAVEKRAKGVPIPMNKSDHSTAIREFMVRNGSLSAEGSILDPGLLTAHIARFNLMPNGLTEILSSHLRDSEIANVRNAAVVVANLQRDQELNHTDYLKDLDAGMHAMAEQAAIEMRRGRLMSDNANDVTIALTAIRDARERGTSGAKSSPEIQSAMADVGIDINEQVNDVIKSYVGELPHGKDSIIENGIFFMDPALNLANVQVPNLARGWFEFKYNTAVSVGVDPDTAAKNASRWALHRLHQETMAIRVNDQVNLFLVPQGFPKEWRWNEAMEKEAMADIAGHPEADTVVSIVPVAGFELPLDEEGKVRRGGYVYYDGMGQRLVNPKTGALLFYEPTEELAKANQQEQETLDARIAKWEPVPSFGEQVKSRALRGEGILPGVGFLLEPVADALFTPSAIGFDPLERFRSPEQIQRRDAMRRLLRDRAETRRAERQRIERDRFTRGSIP